MDAKDGTHKQGLATFAKVLQIFVYGRNLSFTVQLPKSTFTFIHQVQLIIKDVNSNDEAPTVAANMAMEVYNCPSPSQEYVRFLETTLLRTREAFAEAL